MIPKLKRMIDINNEQPVNKSDIWFQTQKNLFYHSCVDLKGNCTYNNGVVTQTTADTNQYINLKLQGFDSNWEYIRLLADTKTIYTTERVSFTFTKQSDIDKIAFGLNGSTIDTLLGITVTHLKNNTVYTLSYNVTNITQGSVSWCDIQLEEGSTATNYQPSNQNNKLFINKNKNYEKFIEESVVVSATEPVINRNNLWIKKRKNLLYTPLTKDNKWGWTATRPDHYKNTSYYCHLLPGVNYTLSYESDARFDGDIEIYLMLNGGADYYIRTTEKTRTFQVNQEGNYYLRADNNTDTEYRSFWNFQVEEGSVATKWEQYKEKEYMYIKNENEVYTEILKNTPSTKTYTATFDNVGNSADTGANVPFSTMFPDLNLSDVICFNTEILDVYTTWDRTYANILMSSNSSGEQGTLQVRSYAQTQTVSVRVTAFYI